MRLPLSKVFLPAFLLLACFATLPLFAQHIAVYGTFNVTHLADVPTGYPQAVAPFQKQFGSITPVGAGGGMSYRVFSSPLSTVDLDLRGAFHDGINGQDNALFGVKLGLNKSVYRIKPYLQASAGFLSAHTRNISSVASGFFKSDHTFTSHFNVYEFLGGLDYPLKTHLDIRVIEVGGGSSFSALPNTSLFTVNTGVVLHF